jgi:NADPH:quinone reductase-like Zn-dependent oxidoreductase
VADLRAKTGGQGVDVVLNSLAGRLLQESFNCLREFGRFVEIGKRDLEQHSGLDMYPFTRNVSFMSVDLRSWGNRRGTRVSLILQKLMQLFEQKQIRPVSPITVFPISKLEKAFRTMQAGQHIGKIVVSVSEQDSVPVSPHPSSMLIDLGIMSSLASDDTGS